MFLYDLFREICVPDRIAGFSFQENLFQGNAMLREIVLHDVRFGILYLFHPRTITAAYDDGDIRELGAKAGKMPQAFLRVKYRAKRSIGPATQQNNNVYF